ncbi:hypothetical protein TNCV_3254341 [Trichonephila clavipes]|nr:hypothetical protein TNCV_3254341 [Trichonephila clavipes]
MNPGSRFRDFFKTTSVCTNNSTTFASAWTLSLEIRAAPTLDSISLTGVFNGVINDESGCMNGETSFFQMNPGSAYSIKMVASVFVGIVVNAHWQRAFVIGILTYHLT